MTLKTWMEFTSDPSEDVKTKTKKWEWYWAPIYCVIWFLLFYVAVIPSFYSYPETLLIRDEHKHPNQFIGERAQIQLLGLSSIGVKMTGMIENEVYAVNYLMKEIDKIKAAARLDLYDIEVEVQQSSGKFMLWGMATSYHNVSNVIVKIAPKSSQSKCYLLVNSHFDSEVGSPAAADAGIMIVIMLETLRVISLSEKPLRNPIVFLLNGAEESNLLAAHGFITQHRWAPYCKALINLDSAGSGGREVLFQSGPNHPWLMKYYKQSVPHPYASTVAEELFQNNFIPSDTDFRIFRDYRGVPGVDMAHTLNGYVYHTKNDNFMNIERGSYQTTGDNVLALTWAIANAHELENTEAHAEGHTVFYDFLGWFMIFYTESTGFTINIVVSVMALLLIAVSIFMMTKQNTSSATPKEIYLRAFLILLVQIVTELAAVGLTILMAVIVDALGLSEAWYSHEWLIFGLYMCPMFFVLGLLPAFYIHWTKQKVDMPLDDTIACFMHAHCVILVFICFLMTGFHIRSAFFPMLAIFFYTCSLVLVLLSKWFCKMNLYLPIHLICQLLPFWFYTYLTFAFLKTFIPMQGRDGPTSKPEFLLSGFSAIMALHFSGFILPILHKYRKPKLFFSIFGVLTIIFVIICATPAGFPYERDLAPQRFYALHTKRVIRDYFGNVVNTTSGFYVQPVDTRPGSLDDTTFKNSEPSSWIANECRNEANCGLPLYNTRWMDWKNSAHWITAAPPTIPIENELKVIGQPIVTGKKVRFEFTVRSADRFVMYVDPFPHTTVTNWTFDRTPLDENYKTPYFVYHVSSLDETPLEFWIEVERDSAENQGPMLRLGVGAHFLYHSNIYKEEFKEFLKTFPGWTYPINWVASYDSWIF